MQRIASIPFLNVQAAYAEIREELDYAVKGVLAGGSYILGAEVDAFECEWASYCEARYALGVGNGLDALSLALRAVGVKPGDEVIVPGHTFIATWLAVTHCGATPVPVDLGPSGFLMAIDGIEEKISPRTKAIIPVHLYGETVDLNPILEMANRRNLAVVEDAAQCHGATYAGRRIGGHGHVTAWSFYPGKNLGAFGDGGAITTDSIEIYQAIQKLRNYGSIEKYRHELLGFNSRLDPLQAAALRVKLRYLDDWNARRVKVAERYYSALNDKSLLARHSRLLAKGDHVFHLFVITTPFRAQLQELLAIHGIETLVHYPIPPHMQQCYVSDGYNSLPVVERVATQVLSLPIGPHLSHSSQTEIINRVNELTSEFRGSSE